VVSEGLSSSGRVDVVVVVVVGEVGKKVGEAKVKESVILSGSGARDNSQPIGPQVASVKSLEGSAVTAHSSAMIRLPRASGAKQR
jgi:hypothetical protein